MSRKTEKVVSGASYCKVFSGIFWGWSFSTPTGVYTL